MNDRIFYFSIAGFCSGVLLRSFFNFSLYFPALFLILSCVVLVYLAIKKANKNIFLTVILLFSFCLGIFSYSFSDKRGNKILDGVVNQKIKTEGIILKEPIDKGGHTNLVIDFGKIFFENGEEKIDGRTVIITESFPKFEYGDLVSVSGVLKMPENFETDGGKNFDYISYLAKDGIFYQMFYPKVELISKNNGSIIKQNLFKLKNAFLTSMEKMIPDPHAALLGGLTVGAQESMGKELQDNFRKTGIIHIIVLSGYNVTIVAEAIMKLFGFLPFLFSSILAGASIIFFAIMTGASSTIIRASIMALLVILARVAKRKYDIMRALFAAGVLMILHNPKILVFDSSFQLSFLATFGLIQISPLIQNYLKIIPGKFGIRESAAAVISTQIFIFPFLLYKMGELSSVSLPVNMLILPFIPATMFVGFLTSIVGFASSFIATPFSWLSYLLLEYELKVVDIFSSFSFSSIKIGTPSIFVIILIYGIYFFFLHRVFKKNKSDKRGIIFSNET